jgi:hypothetical protein
LELFLALADNRFLIFIAGYRHAVVRYASSY